MHSEDSYRRAAAKLEDQRRAAELAWHESQEDEPDIDGLLAFGAHILSNTPHLKLDDWKQRLQQVLFPQGVTYADGRFGTAETSAIFRVLQALPGGSERKATLAVSSLNRVYEWLGQVSAFKQGLAA